MWGGGANITHLPQIPRNQEFPDRICEALNPFSNLHSEAFFANLSEQTHAFQG